MNGILAIVAFFLAIFAISYIVTCFKTAAFNKKFPPISDKEFLARCKPGTNPEIAIKVRRIVSDQLGVDYERVHPSASFFEDLGCD